MSYLLIDHPALPIPFHNSSGLVFEQPVAMNEAQFAHKDRLICAIQVLALDALMAEFEMWLPRRAIRTARVVDRGNGKQVIVGGYPVALSKLYNRLGGGETATRVMRDATVQTVCERFRVSLPDEIDSGDQGWFLDPFLANVLDRLSLPIDRITARNLWAVLWPQPRLPEDGEIIHISLPDRATSIRLGTSIVAQLRQKRRLAWLREVAEDGAATAPYPAYGSRGTLILTGIFSEHEILAVERWVQLEGCSACLVGVFPQTWSVSKLLHDTSRDLVQLAVVGAPRARCRIEIEKRSRRSQQGFAHSAAEREALTTAARTLFAPHEETIADETSGVGKRVFHMLSLLPEGLPEGFISCFTETKGTSLKAILASLPVVFGNNAWRLVSQRLMVRDPLHLDVSGLFSDDDPRSLLHRALGGNPPAELIQWMRSRIDDLESDAVRSLFAGVGPGELGREVRLLHIEACLAELDPAGARLAAQGLERDEAAAHNAWVNAIDPPAGWNLPEGLWDEVERLPGAAAEVALFSLRTIKALNRDESLLLEERLGQAISKMQGLRRRWYEIEAASVLNGAQLEDRHWRRQLAGYEPKLRRHMLHKLAIRYTKTKRFSKAGRILKRLAAVTMSPGRLALIYQDLSSIEAETGREDADVWFLLKALRLFEAAGFQDRSRNVLFNLAANDLDHLELERAERRLEHASGGVPDIFNRLEMARLALARGDESRLSEILAELGSWTHAEHIRIREALQLLIGVEHLLRGNLVAATKNLENGGNEAKAWLDIVRALQGKRPGVRSDVWGLHSAARIIYAARQASSAPVSFNTENRIEDALALALVARLLDRVPPMPQVRWASRLLERRGMSGWATWLTAGDHIGLGFAGGLVSLIEGGLLPDLPLDATSEIFSGIGITGLEVRSSDGQVLWICGEGEPGPERRHGRLLFVPLGGDPAGNIEWRLLTGVLDLTTPLLPQSDEVEVSKTGILGISEGVRELRTELMAYAPAAVTVLLLGETGVGKEVAAHAVHRLSGRRGGFAAINIAGMPESLVEVELFGAVKGAFTGADRNRKGIVESVDGGTLFLDEIGDLGLPMQVKLLRFLESFEVRPVGSDHTHIVDVRIVAATHRDLEEGIRLGTFREDLFYRISTAPVKIPPLRDRRQDILLLRDYFERELCAANGYQLQRWSREAESALLNFDWPGNIRQLKNVVEKAVMRFRGVTIRPEMLSIKEVHSASRRGSWEEVQADFRREYLSHALKQNGGNRSATARELGISRQALLYQIKTLRLK